jgi:hypothetical protein
VCFRIVEGTSASFLEFECTPVRFGIGGLLQLLDLLLLDRSLLLLEPLLLNLLLLVELSDSSLLLLSSEPLCCWEERLGVRRVDLE